jgi:hypothetical protein
LVLWSLEEHQKNEQIPRRSGAGYDSRARLMSPEDIDPDDHQTRDMYARFGLAMYSAQVLEAGLKSAISAAQVTSARFSTIDEFDESWALNFTATMGKLLRRLEPFLGGDRELVDDLSLALRIRNQLAHHFFWDHVADAATTRGRARMIDECMAAVEFFQEIEQRLRVVVRRYAESTDTPPGVFLQRVEQSIDDMLASPEETGSKNCGRCLTSMEVSGNERHPYWKCPNCGSLALA